MEFNTGASEVDLMKLYCEGDTKMWNAFLTKCFANNDLAKLTMIRQGLQRNMKKLASRNVNSEGINNLFLRLTMSIERTVTKIYYKNGKPKNKVEKKKLQLLAEKLLKDTAY